MRVQTPLPRMMSFHRDREGRKTGGSPRRAAGLPLRIPSKELEAVGGSVLASVVTRLMRRATLAQVWMDHICFRPAAASGFRLTLKDGAEPSLGAPGPE
jgi:hypothetical protein